MVALLCGAQPPSQPDETQPNKAREPVPLVVMSFNIRYGTANDGENAWPKRRQMVIDRIRASGADVIGLQEALKFQIDELLAAMPEYGTVGVGRENGIEKGEHASIFYRRSRLKIEPAAPPHDEHEPVAGHGDFWYSDIPETPGSKSWGNSITRICTWARFRDIDESHAFYVFNTHFDHESQPSREKSAKLLKRRIASRAGGDAVVVTGDFNAGEKNPAIVTMVRVDQPADAMGPVCPPLRDSFRVTNPDEKIVGTFNGFKGTTTGDKIDYIFVDNEWEVLESAIDRTMPDGMCPSDHFPVIAELRQKRTPPGDTTP
jgi:endonuclease/exonuclease/phosphatase family metal-dependent hydrolase